MSSKGQALFRADDGDPEVIAAALIELAAKAPPAENIFSGRIRWTPSGHLKAPGALRRELLRWISDHPEYLIIGDAWARDVH